VIDTCRVAPKLVASMAEVPLTRDQRDNSSRPDWTKAQWAARRQAARLVTSLAK